MSNFIRNLIGFSLSSWIGFFIGIISVPLLTRILEPLQFAMLNQFLAASNLAMAITCLGMDSAFVRFHNEPPAGFTSELLLGKILSIIFLLLFFISLFALPFSRIWLPQIFGEAVSPVVAWGFIFAVMAEVIIRLFTTRYRMTNSIAAYTVLTVSLQLVSKFGVLLSLPFGKNSTILLLSCSFALVLLGGMTLLHGIIRGGVRSTRIKLLADRSFVSYSIASWPVPVLIFGNTYFTQVIIRNAAGTEVLGVFLSANFFASILGVFQSGFSNYWSAYMFSNYSKSQSKIIKMHDYICLFTVVILSLFVMSRDLVYLFIGPRFYGSKKIFALVLSAPLMNMIVETTAYGISIAKKAHYSLISYSILFILNITFAIVLTPRFGMYGAGVAIIISSTVNLLIQTILGQRYYKSINNYGKLSFSLASILLIANINYFIDNTFIISIVCFIILILSTIVFKSTVIEIYAKAYMFLKHKNA